MSSAGDDKMDTGTNSTNNNNNDFSVSALEAAADAILQHNFDAVTKPCFVTLLKLLDNCIQKPNAPQYRTVKLSNAAIQAKIVSTKHGVAFLQACGFVVDDTNNNTNCLVLKPETENTQLLITARRLLKSRAIQELGCKPDELPVYKPPPPQVSVAGNEQQANSSASSNTLFNPYQGHRFDAASAAVGANLGPDANYKSKTELELQRLQQNQNLLKAQLHSSQNKLNREWQAVRPGQSFVATNMQSSTTAAASNEKTNTTSDASLLAARAQKQQKERLQREQGGFTTAAMRQVEKLKRQKVYSHVTLQIQFPDGCRVSAKFWPSETVQTVAHELRQACFVVDSNEYDFDLYVAPPRRVLALSSTLEQEQLVPAAKLFVSWKTAPPPPPKGDYLKPELFTINNTVQQQPLYPSSHAVAMVDDEKKPAAASASSKTSDNDNKKKNKKNREEELMRRMMGGGGSSMLGKRSDGDSSSSSKKPASSGGGKPKWFKG